MSLRDLDLLSSYRSDECNLVDDFYVPCLERSTLYLRAVGYFTGTSLSAAARGLTGLTSHGGHMRLVASPQLQEEDWSQLQAGYAMRDLVERSALRALNVQDPIIRQRLGFLGWLVARGSLDVKLAVKDDDLGGIYHEKVGICQDADGNRIAFVGSVNETVSGWSRNFESLDVFRSWVPIEADRVVEKVDAFERLWSNDTVGLRVVPFPDAVRAKLISLAPREMPARDPESSHPSRRQTANPSLPVGVTLRAYQNEAIDSWFTADCHGVLSMATGTGKTLTAVGAALRLLEREARLCVVVVAPYIHLAEQWAEELEACHFGSVIRAYGSKADWSRRLGAAVASLATRARKCMAVVTTDATFGSGPLASLWQTLGPMTMLIADEVHHLGAPTYARALPSNVPFRLGLSATPTRWMDEDGTKALDEYFGGVVYELPLEKAIGTFLCRYYYVPIFVYLTDQEHDEYMRLTKAIGRAWGDDSGSGPSIRAQSLIFRRTRLVGGAVNKVSALRHTVQPFVDSSFNLFYCSPGRQIDGVPQIEAVQRSLGRDLRMRVHQFTASEDNDTRTRLLNLFESGDLQGLVAIRCLDEGVDVPATRQAFILASSQNPREFIQRRGRVLRKHPGKEYATIYDFVTLPNDPEDVKFYDSQVLSVERRLLGAELRRVAEFGAWAVNAGDVLATLRPIRALYDAFEL